MRRFFEAFVFGVIFTSGWTFFDYIKWRAVNDGSDLHTHVIMLLVIVTLTFWLARDIDEK